MMRAILAELTGHNRDWKMPDLHVNEPTKVLTKHELITKIISTLIGLGASFAVTYFGIKWLTNVMDPTRKEKQAAQTRAQELLKKIGVGNVKLSDYELCIAANLVNPKDVNTSWEDIAGLRNIIEEIKRSVILPLEKRSLFTRSTLLQPPKGVLLYGPPGCGKTMIAKATAKAAGARFINLQVSALVDKWYGESQKRAEAVFSLALKLQPTIVFIDEIDSFLRSRSSRDHEATAMIKTQFMSFWDGLITDPSCYVIIMGATNRPQDVDAAILRRMPSSFYIGLPEKHQREDLFHLILRSEETEEDLDFAKLAELSNGFSGSDIKEVCRTAALATLHEFISCDISNEQNSCSRLRAITMSDLADAIYKIKKSTKQVTNAFPAMPDFD